jgi:hypothetical protein
MRLHPTRSVLSICLTRMSKVEVVMEIEDPERNRGPEIVPSENMARVVQVNAPCTECDHVAKEAAFQTEKMAIELNSIKSAQSELDGEIFCPL